MAAFNGRVHELEEVGLALDEGRSEGVRHFELGTGGDTLEGGVELVFNVILASTSEFLHDHRPPCPKFLIELEEPASFLDGPGTLRGGS